MIGAIIGDVVGSRFEYRCNSIKTTEFDLFSDKCKFTDDTVLTIATADAILNNKSYSDKYQEYGKLYPKAGYGKSFKNWIHNPITNDSWGNGSSMRVSPIGWAFNENDVIKEAEKSSICSHADKDAIKCATLVSYCIYLARIGKSKENILEYCKLNSTYNFNRTIDDIRETYSFTSKASESIPESILCFYESIDFESAIRLAISLGGDSDTQACISGAIAEAYYKYIPTYIIDNTLKRIPENFKNIITKFKSTYNIV